MTEIERIIASHEEAIKEGWIDTNECGDPFWDDFVKLVEYARSTLTPPDTQGALADAFIKMANLEKENERLRDECYKRQSWLDKAKSDAGYDRNVSFDVVWKDALQALTRPSSEAKLIDAANSLVNTINAEGGHGYIVHGKAKVLQQAIAEAEGE